MEVIAFTGAGISKSAGIPTYEEHPELKGMLSVEMREKHYGKFLLAVETLMNNVKDKKPTKAHKILARLNIPIITMNIDNLHRMAGSKEVYEIHGNYLKNNIVLYGEPLHYAEEVLTLITKTAKRALKNKEDAVLLVIGTSMQTTFANVIARFAESKGMKVLYIDENADEEVEQFFKITNMI